MYLILVEFIFSSCLLRYISYYINNLKSYKRIVCKSEKVAYNYYCTVRL